jgi:Zn-finger nucleic acid-binding protein
MGEKELCPVSRKSVLACGHIQEMDVIVEQAIDQLRDFHGRKHQAGRKDQGYQNQENRFKRFESFSNIHDIIPLWR